MRYFDQKIMTWIRFDTTWYYHEILDYAYDELAVYVTGKCAWFKCEANTILRIAEDLAKLNYVLAIIGD